MADTAGPARVTDRSVRTSATLWRARVSLARPAQWTKNAFVVAPVFFAMDLHETDAVVRTLLATLAFCFASSAVYVLNDWTDREADAQHRTKHNRPLASGVLGGRDAVIQAGVLACLAVAAMVPLYNRPEAWAPLVAYGVLNVAYSLWLRDVNLVDIAIIAAGFVLRVLAGAGAVGVQASSWIILCTGLLALLLALGKRRGDIGLETAVERASLASYNLVFIDLGIATLAGAVITFYALFTVSDYSLQRFESEYLYLTTFPVALGVLRYLQSLVEGLSGGSPSEILVRDRVLQVLIVSWGVLFALLTTLGKDVA